MYQLSSVCLALLILAGCLGACGGEEASRHITLSELSGPTWQLERMKSGGTEAEVSKEVLITLRVDAGGQVTGRSAVNRYFAKLNGGGSEPIQFSTSGIGSTRMAGPPDHMKLESAYLSALARVRSGTRRDTSLILRSEDGSDILEFVAGE
jgi:heat shock protein HslJ